MNKDKKLIIHCVVCKKEIKVTPEELKSKKLYGEYIIRHGSSNSLTAVQGGTLCEECLKKTLDQKVVNK